MLSLVSLLCLYHISDYIDNKIEEFYNQLQNVIDQTPKKDILAVQGDWNAKAVSYTHLRAHET